jgi:hypothetical protein
MSSRRKRARAFTLTDQVHSALDALGKRGVNLSRFTDDALRGRLGLPTTVEQDNDAVASLGEDQEAA